LRFDPPSGVSRLGGQHGALDDERVLLQTRTTAPDEAP
jgi:hypothetical protein